MKERILPLLLAVCLLIGVSGCGAEAADKGDGAQDRESAVYTGKIVQVSGDSVMLAGQEGELCRLSVKELPLTDAQGAAMTADQLRRGMMAQVSYDGLIQETYPVGLSGPAGLRVSEQGDELVGMYLSVIDTLYQNDTGLNGEIEMLAFDLSGAVNLDAGEKAALRWLAGEKYGLSTIEGTHQELEEQGYIESLYFKNGLLFTIADTPISEGAFPFRAVKWRGGDGAIGYDTCSAVRNDGGWEYTLGGFWIS